MKLNSVSSLLRFKKFLFKDLIIAKELSIDMTDSLESIFMKNPAKSNPKLDLSLEK